MDFAHPRVGVRLLVLVVALLPLLFQIIARDPTVVVGIGDIEVVPHALRQQLIKYGQPREELLVVVAANRRHDDDRVRSWFYPRLAERQRSTDTERAEFLRRLDTPGRVVIELEPVDWITYDGVRLESALRDVDYDPRRVKPSRNRRRPPDGISTTSFD